MTIQQFKYLSHEEQEFILITRAVFLSAIDDDDDDVYTLFQLDGFYLEVVCTGEKVIVSSISYFEETDLLDPYLELINIDSIYTILRD